MSYSVDPISDNCYEGTTCLINKFDIHDEETLAKIEAQITVAKAAEPPKLRCFGGCFNVFRQYRS